MTNSNAQALLGKSYFRNEEKTWGDLCKRVAHAISIAEETPSKQKKYEEIFYYMMESMDFIPSSPCLMNAGTTNQQLSSCFILDIQDNLESIYGNVKTEMAKIFQKNGGVGFNISALRPSNSPVETAKGYSCGALGFMEEFDLTADIVTRNNQRKGAIKIDMSDFHPDIEEFIKCKDDTNKYTHMNISVALSDKFMNAIKNNEKWNLRFPDFSACKEIYNKEWNGDIEEWESKGYPVKIYKTIDARNLYYQIMEHAWKTGEPGVSFLDNMNRDNPNPKLGKTTKTNPCSEFVSIPYNSCNLGSINLSNFAENGEIDNVKLEACVRFAVRFLDDMITVNHLPLKKLEDVTKKVRSVGLGTMGMADMLYKLNIPYNSKEAEDFLNNLYSFIKDTAENASEYLADEKGVYFHYKDSVFDKKGIKRRNSNLISVAPNGCQKPSTLVPTNHGILRLDEIVNLNEKWFDVKDKDIYIEQENKNEQVSKTYNNGFAETVIIKTSSGIDLESTYNHQYKIIRDGEYKWCRADEIMQGDLIPSKIGYYDKKEYIELKSIHQSNYNNICKVLKLPKYLDEDVAFILGAYLGNGSTHKNSIRFSMNKEKQEDIKKISDLLYKCFGTQGKVVNEKTTDTIYFSSVNLLEFFKTNDLIKNKANKIEIPKAIRMSPKTVIESFFKGYAMCDGSHTGKTTYIDTSSYEMAQQIAIIKRAIGQNTRVVEDTKRTGAKSKAPMYRVYNVQYGSSDFDTSKERYIPLELRNNYKLSKDLINSSFICDIVTEIKYGETLTLDIEVPVENYYIANGYVSHNSISFIANTSGGLEPNFALVYTRRTNDNTIYHVVNPVFEQYLKENNLYTKEILQKIADNNGSCQGIDEIQQNMQKIFVTAHDITPNEHLSVLTAIQQYVDLACSKTINLSHDATVADIEDIYLQAWENGIKGITVYRDGARENQTLSVKRQEESSKTTLARGDWRPKAKDTTYYQRKLTIGCGKLSLFIGWSDNEKCIQDFYVTRSGQGGCERLLQSTAISMSAILRLGGDIKNIEKAFRGIGGCNSFATQRGKGHNLSKGNSCGIAILNEIKAFLAEKQDNNNNVKLPTESKKEEISHKNKEEVKQNAMTKCPECGEYALVTEGGCNSCKNCGYSRCG